MFNMSFLLRRVILIPKISILWMEMKSDDNKIGLSDSAGNTFAPTGKQILIMNKAFRCLTKIYVIHINCSFRISLSVQVWGKIIFKDNESVKMENLFLVDTIQEVSSINKADKNFNEFQPLT